MEQQRAAGEAEGDPRPPRRVALFVAALAGYYIVYYWIFVGRVGEYFADILRHFAFVRRLLP
ncbi:MAG TPA: hypothetical protein VNM14_01130 [Planctomycetota bacterium]|jgi:hypothetical protein|nr:hypothetical protein [Planctomycetota bacterium]